MVSKEIIDILPPLPTLSAEEAEKVDRVFKAMMAEETGKEPSAKLLTDLDRLSPEQLAVLTHKILSEPQRKREEKFVKQIVEEDGLPYPLPKNLLN